MPRPPLIVLKFGGSVLRDELTLRRAVHEIHRWRRERFRVVAVVSAMAGVTDSLLVRTRRAGTPSDFATAALLAGGERESAALLGLHLDRAGIPARVLDPAALGLRAQGPPLDADPVDLDVHPLQVALDADEVVVVPGFFALDAAGRTVLLGRGGSDLSALFLADRLGAERCRLIKDVDGLYEWDPAVLGPSPRRFVAATFEDALATDGSILQHKAVRFAQSWALRFEVGACNRDEATSIGAEAARFGAAPAHPRTLDVALLGLGTVNGGLSKLLGGLPDLLRVRAVLVRDLRRARDVEVDPGLLTTNPEDALENADVVVEAMGGVEPARSFIDRALDRGIHVVTANKSVVAAHGADLRALADRRGCRFLHSAAVGGCMPVLERLACAPGAVVSIRGVLNGTANFVLERLAEGFDLPSAVLAAREHGFAEEDPSRDLEGRDAAEKLSILASATGCRLSPEGIPCETITAATAQRVRMAAARDCVLRQVSTLRVDVAKAWASVGLEEVETHDPLAGVRAEGNAVTIAFADGRLEVVAGRGAGRWPTAESLLGDLLEIVRTDPSLSRVPAGRKLSHVG